MQCPCIAGLLLPPNTHCKDAQAGPLGSSDSGAHSGGHTASGAPSPTAVPALHQQQSPAGKEQRLRQSPVQPAQNQPPTTMRSPPGPQSPHVPTSPAVMPGSQPGTQDAPDIELPPHYLEQQAKARRKAPTTVTMGEAAGRPDDVAVAAGRLPASSRSGAETQMGHLGSEQPPPPAKGAAPPAEPGGTTARAQQHSQMRPKPLAGRGSEQLNSPVSSHRARASPTPPRNCGHRVRSPRGAAPGATADRPLLPRSSRPGSCPPIMLPPVRLGPPPPVRSPSSAVPASGPTGLANARQQAQQRKQPPPPEPRFSALPPVSGSGGFHHVSAAASAAAQQPLRSVSHLALGQQPWLGPAGGCDGLFAAAGSIPAAQIPTASVYSPGAASSGHCES